MSQVQSPHLARAAACLHFTSISDHDPLPPYSLTLLAYSVQHTHLRLEVSCSHALSCVIPPNTTFSRPRPAAASRMKSGQTRLLDLISCLAKKPRLRHSTLVLIRRSKDSKSSAGSSDTNAASLISSGKGYARCGLLRPRSAALVRDDRQHESWGLRWNHISFCSCAMFIVSQA